MVQRVSESSELMLGLILGLVGVDTSRGVTVEGSADNILDSHEIVCFLRCVCGGGRGGVSRTGGFTQKSSIVPPRLCRHDHNVYNKEVFLDAGVAKSCRCRIAQLCTIGVSMMCCSQLLHDGFTASARHLATRLVNSSHVTHHEASPQLLNVYRAWAALGGAEAAALNHSGTSVRLGSSHQIRHVF